MPVSCASSQAVMFRVKDKLSKRPPKGRLQLPPDCRFGSIGCLEAALADSLHEDEVFGSTQVRKPPDSPPHFTVHQTGCNARAPGQAGGTLSPGRHVSQGSAAFKKGRRKRLKIAVDDSYLGIAPGGAGKACEPSGLEPNPGIGQCHPFEKRGGNPEVSPASWSRVPGFDHADPVVAAARRTELLQRAVAAPSIHKNNLIGRPGLSHDAVEQRIDAPFFVPYWNHKRQRERRWLFSGFVTRFGRTQLYLFPLNSVTRWPRACEE